MTQKFVVSLVVVLLLIPVATAAGAAAPSITLEQVLAVALQSGVAVRTATSSLEAAKLELAAAQRNAGLQVMLGSTTTPTYELAHADNSPLPGYSIPGTDFGLADSRSTSLRASVEYVLPTGGRLTLSEASDYHRWKLVANGTEDDSQDNVATLRLRQPIFADPAFASPRYEVRQASHQAERANLLLVRARRDTHLQVLQAFCAILEAQDEVDLAGESVAGARENSAYTRTLAEVGSAGELEVEAADIRLEQSLLAQARAEQALAVARRQLANALGVPVDDSARAVEVAPPTVKLTAEQATRSWASASVDVALKELAVREAQDALRKAGVALGLQADLQAAYSDDQTWSLGVGVSWSPTQDAASRQLVTKAQKALDETRAALADAKANLDVESLRAYHDYLNADQELAIATLAADRAKRFLDLTVSRQKAGTATVREVNEAEVQYRQAEKERKAAARGCLVAVTRLQVEAELLK